MNEIDIFCQKILYKEYSFDLSKLLINIIKKEKYTKKVTHNSSLDNIDHRLMRKTT